MYKVATLAAALLVGAATANPISVVDEVYTQQPCFQHGDGRGGSSTRIANAGWVAYA